MFGFGAGASSPDEYYNSQPDASRSPGGSIADSISRNIRKRTSGRYSLPDSAGALADEYRLSDMAAEGLGYGWQQNFVRSALRANYNPRQMMVQYGGGMALDGAMAFSGAFQDKLPGEIAAAGVTMAMQANETAAGQNRDVADRAFGTMLGLAQNRDSMRLQYDLTQQQIAAQKKASKRTWWDHLTGAVSAFVPGVDLFLDHTGGSKT